MTELDKLEAEMESAILCDPFLQKMTHDLAEAFVEPHERERFMRCLRNMNGVAYCNGMKAGAEYMRK